LPNVFFNEEIDLSKGFEAPATIRAVKGSAIEMPEPCAAAAPKQNKKVNQFANQNSSTVSSGVLGERRG